MRRRRFFFQAFLKESQALRFSGRSVSCASRRSVAFEVALPQGQVRDGASGRLVEPVPLAVSAPRLYSLLLDFLPLT